MTLMKWPSNTDVLIVGASLGGVSAAYAACQAGCHVVLAGKYSWIGGQLTSQAVPPDDNSWVETVGSSASYQRLRQHIRDYYRSFYPLKAPSRVDPHLNIGGAFASTLAHEPRVSHAVLLGLLSPFICTGRLTVITSVVPLVVDADNDCINSVTFQHLTTGYAATIACCAVLDATDTGELLQQSGIAYVIGAESQRDTNEPSASLQPNPAAIQAITTGFVVDHREDEDHTIPRPAAYDNWYAYQPDAWAACGVARQLSWAAPHPRQNRKADFAFQPDPVESHNAGIKPTQGEQVLSEVNLWRARRLVARRHFDGFAGDVTVVNWLQNDYMRGSAYGGTDDENQQHIEGAKELSRCLLYWMQTEAPRQDGGKGYPGLRLRPDQTATEDGFAQAPYIRESRRIRALETIVEQDISAAYDGNQSARHYPDSVGIGAWWVDLHPTPTGDGFLHLPTYPFEIPLGALVPIQAKNLIPACKNIGTTHITNGAYRVHHVEWAVGEAAGTLATYCVKNELSVQDVYHSHGQDYCLWLDKRGVRRYWPDQIRQQAVV